MIAAQARFRACREKNRFPSFRIVLQRKKSALVKLLETVKGADASRGVFWCLAGGIWQIELYGL
jgi:hypothetical protein